MSFLVVVHGTPAVLYETLRYSWAWKHLGLVDYLARHHTVDTHVANLNVYQSWPGFFSTAATWFVGSHASSWIGPAQWAPLFFELLDVLALYAIFHMLESDRRVVWTALWLFSLGNWIGQDYFSPQAFAFFLYLVVVLVVVRWPAGGRRCRGSRACARPRHRRVDGRALTGAVGRGRALCTAAIASSHPLTPFVLVVGVGARRDRGRARRSPARVAVAAVVAAWLVTGGLGYMRASLPSILGELTSLGGTVDQSLSKSAHASASQHVVSLMGRVEVVVVVVVAARGSRAPSPPRPVGRDRVALAVAPVAILAGGAYGGEAVFRVYFFALPFLALPRRRRRCYPTPAHRQRPIGGGRGGRQRRHAHRVPVRILRQGAVGALLDGRAARRGGGVHGGAAQLARRRRHRRLSDRLRQLRERAYRCTWRRSRRPRSRRCSPRRSRSSTRGSRTPATRRAIS